MKQVCKYVSTIFMVVIFCVIGKAQTDFGSYFLEGTWAGRELNASDSLRGKVEIYLPGIYFESHHSNEISLKDIFRQNGQGNTVNISNIINKFDDVNTLENNFKLNTIGVGLKVKNFDIDIRHNVRFKARLDYPKELVKLIFEGNSQYIGETVDFGSSVDFFSYHEYGVGASRKFGPLSLGARVKYLSGIGLIKTNGTDASLFTDDDVYQLTLDTDYTILTSNSLDIDGLSDFTFQGDLANNFFSSNTGWAFDLAASFQVSDALKFSASLVDIGFIVWNDDTSGFTSQGSYTYEGFDLDDFLLNDDVEFDVKLDTLEDIFEFEESSAQVNTDLGTKLYFAGQYQLNEKIQVGALLVMNNTAFEGNAFGLNVQYSLGKSSLIGLNYSHRKDSFSNLGIQFLASVGPVVIFGNTDNIFSVVSNDNFRFNGRLGLGLSF